MLERIAGDKRSWTRIGAVAVAATSTALLVSPASADVAAENSAYPAVQVFTFPSYTGHSTELYGNDNQCRYVGSDWNDRIRSAKAYGAPYVELWEDHDCTGYSIVVDADGYWRIGAWVSAFRPRP